MHFFIFYISISFSLLFSFIYFFYLFIYLFIYFIYLFIFLISSWEDHLLWCKMSHLFSPQTMFADDAC